MMSASAKGRKKSRHLAANGSTTDCPAVSPSTVSSGCTVRTTSTYSNSASRSFCLAFAPGDTSRRLVAFLPLAAFAFAVAIAVYSWYGREQNNGGWLPNNEADWKAYGTNICTIDKVHIRDLTRSTFELLYKQRKPLIITFPNGSADWCDVDQWTTTSIRRVYGNWNVTMGKAVELVYSGGRPDNVYTFNEFLDEMRLRTQSPDPWYLFDRTFYPTSSLPKSIHVPNFLFTDEDSIFFLGSSGTGATFHKHMPAWNGVVFGRKRWILYPVEKTPPGGLHGYNSAAWLRNVYPHLSPADKPLECMQETGEIFYVPESYYHAVLNLGETIAVSLQMKQTITDIETKFYRALSLAHEAVEIDDDNPEAQASKKGLYKDAIKTYTDLHLALPGNTEILYDAAGLYYNMKKEGRARTLYERVLSMDRFYVKAYLSMAYWYYDHHMPAEEEQMYKAALSANPDSKEAWHEYAAMLHRRDRLKEAFQAYAKHLQLVDTSTDEGSSTRNTLWSLNRVLLGNHSENVDGPHGPSVTVHKRTNNGVWPISGSL